MNLLFFDIDGTLITDDDEHLFPEDAKEALREVQAAGNKIFINTGRVFCNVESWIKDGFDGIICACGTDIRIGDKQVFYHAFPKELCRDIALACRKYRFSALFEHAEHTAIDPTFAIGDIGVLIDYFSRDDRWLITDIDDPDFCFDKFSCFYDENSDVEGFRAYISRWFQYIDREGNFCELVPKGFSKATGIQFLLDYYGLSKHNTYVFGDGNNDLEMLRFSPHAVTMGLGSDLAKEAADFVTSDVREGGIRRALQHYGLIQ